MGQAANRKQRRALAAQGSTMLPNVEPVRVVVKKRELNGVLVDMLAFNTEYNVVAKDNPHIGPVMFAEAVLESGLEHMRQAREAREYEEKHKNDLVHVATPQQVAQVLAPGSGEYKGTRSRRA